MKVKIVQFFSSIILFSSICFADDLQRYALAICPAHYQHCRGSVRHIDGGGIGYNQGYTTFDGFFATEPNEQDFMPFLDFRGHIFNDGKIATNVGGGCRKILKNRIYGGNIYYDYRRFAGLDFNQLGLGLETLGTRWDVRLNGYLPVGEQINTPYSSEFSQFSGNNMILLEKYRLVMTGANAEFGVHFGKSKRFDFYACAGPYYFHEKIDCKPNLYGGKVRLSAKFKQYWILEISDSYDRIFKNRFQAQLTLNIPFGAGAKNVSDMSADICDALFSRMVQPVDRQEIIVIDKKQQCAVAIDPETCEPYNFVFVDNQSNSEGTYESPYPTLALAQANSKVGDIIYVFPGDGTTRGMNSGITLKNNQKFWGSSIDHALVTTRGDQVIPAQTDTAPTMTNTNVDTLGDGITLASINEISGINLANVLNSSIIGTNVSNISISDCMIQGSTVYSVDIASSSVSKVLVMDNVMKNNTNSCRFSFNGPSSVLSVMNNSITGTTSVSSKPIEIISFANPLIATINDNTIYNNRTGGLSVTLNNTNGAQLNVHGNTITNNQSGFASSLGSAFVLSPNNTTTGNCTLNLTNNIFTGNEASCLYCSQGGYANLTVNATANTMTGNGGSGLAFDNPCSNAFTLIAANNTISSNNDNGIATLGGRVMTTANLSITDNSITNLANQSNAIAVVHAGTTCNFTALRNNLSSNEGSGILMYPSPAITNVTVDIQNNTVSSNQNAGSNATGGIDIEQFRNLLATIKNNTMLGNTGAGLYVNSAEATPTACITLTGNNSSTNYTIDSGTGTFNLAPCNASSLNTGTINTSGTVTSIQSCPGGAPCA